MTQVWSLWQGRTWWRIRGSPRTEEVEVENEEEFGGTPLDKGVVSGQMSACRNCAACKQLGDRRNASNS